MKSSLDKWVLNEINQRDPHDHHVSCIGLAARLRSNEETIAQSIASLQDEGLVSRRLVVDDAPQWFRKRHRKRAKQLPLFTEEK